FVLGSVSANPKGRELAWQFVKKNWEALNAIYAGGFLLNRLVTNSASDFASEEKAKEVEEFFETHKAPAAERAIKQAVESIRSNARWLERDGAAVGKWLEERY